MSYEPGDRVFAIRNGDELDKKLYVFGPGVYAGRFEPPASAGFPAGMTNPRIDLDNGDTTWGMECWWGGEHDMAMRYPTSEWEYVQVESKIGPHRWCCTACKGTGSTLDGPCFDCLGTGHTHKVDA